MSFSGLRSLSYIHCFYHYHYHYLYHTITILASQHGKNTLWISQLYNITYDRNFVYPPGGNWVAVSSRTQKLKNLNHYPNHQSYGYIWKELSRKALRAIQFEEVQEVLSIRISTDLQMYTDVEYCVKQADTTELYRSCARDLNTLLVGWGLGRCRHCRGG